MPDSNTLALFFSTVAVLVATLTGLISAFSTFRLQSIANELSHLIQIMRSRSTPAGTLDEWIERTHYTLLERIYDTDPGALAALRRALDQSGLLAHSAAYEHDYANVAKNRQRYQAVKRTNQRGFRWALSYVFLSLVLLLLNPALLQLRPYWLLTGLSVYLALAAYTFGVFIRQLDRMTVDTWKHFQNDQLSTGVGRVRWLIA